MSERVYDYEQAMKQVEERSKTYDLNADVENTVGKVTFSPRDLADLEKKINSGWWAQQTDQPQQPGMTEPHESPTQSASIKSWNDITNGISKDGGFHFTQGDRLFYKQGNSLYHAKPIAGGDYSISTIPKDEAQGIITKEIDNNGDPVFAKNNHYQLHNGTVHGRKLQQDGTLGFYPLAPDENKYIYNVANTAGKVDDGLQAPYIDPIDVVASGLVGGAGAAVKSSGNTLRRLASGAKAGSVEMLSEVGNQIVTNIATDWYKK